MLQNGLIILNVVWSLVRMAHFAHDPVTNVMTDFPIVNFPYLSIILRNTFLIIERGIFFTETTIIRSSYQHTELVHKCDISTEVTRDWFPVILLKNNRCNM